MRKSALVLSSLLMMSGAATASTEISGVTLPDSIAPQGQTLNYNGAGVRSKFFIDLYVGSLFTVEKMTEGHDVINSDQPTAIRLNITSDMITSEKMSNAMHEGFDLATNGNTAPLADSIETFIKTFAGTVKTGDQYTLVSVPGTGITCYKNGEQLSVIAGEDFRKAVLKIWLGKKPTDDDLKDEMLDS